MISDTLGSASDRLLVAVLVALALHAALIFGVRFRLPQPQRVDRVLDIELVQRPDSRRSDQADYRADQDSDGGAPRRAKPRPVARTQPPGRLRAGDRARPQPGKPLLTRQDSGETALPPEKQRSEQPRLNPGILARQIAELGVTPRPQIRFGSERVTPIKQIRAHKYVAAAYERAWQEKVERIGNLNYPDEARRRGLSGRLLISVWVAKDGTVRKIKIHRSSGHKVLDQAAVRIVRLAAPFAPFPKELAAQTDVLVITRTWNFYNEAGLAMGR